MILRAESDEVAPTRIPENSPVRLLIELGPKPRVSILTSSYSDLATAQRAAGWLERVIRQWLTVHQRNAAA